MNKPDKYFNRDNKNFDPYRSNGVPSLSWGNGMSPLLKDQPHSILAVGWGPLIQLAVLIDSEENDKPFILDGFYIVRIFDMEEVRIPPQISTMQEENKSEVTDFLAFQHSDTCYIESMIFLSDSTLLIFLSGSEIRILDTQSFLPEHYDADRIFANPLGVKRQSSKQTLPFPEELEAGIQCTPVLKPEATVSNPRLSVSAQPFKTTFQYPF